MALSQLNVLTVENKAISASPANNPAKSELGWNLSALYFYLNYYIHL